MRRRCAIYTCRRRCRRRSRGLSRLHAALPHAQGAGGVITDWAGRPLMWHPQSADAQVSPGEVLAAGDARVHAQAMSILDWR